MNGLVVVPMVVVLVQLRCPDFLYSGFHELLALLMLVLESMFLYCLIYMEVEIVGILECLVCRDPGLILFFDHLWHRDSYWDLGRLWESCPCDGHHVVWSLHQMWIC